MHVLFVGSSVIDLFLTADNDFFKIEGEKVSFNLGDKIPSDVRRFGIGGNGANVSVGLTRLEIPSSFYTYLGTDALSREIEEGLRREGVEVIVDSEKTDTPPVSIIVDFDNDRIIFSHHQKKEYSFTKKEAGFDFIYLTSIGKAWENAYRQVIEYSKSTSTPIAFSPGSSQIDNFNETAKEVLASSKIFFSNKEEAEVALGKEKGTDIKSLLSGLLEKGPEIVSITDAENGAYAADKNGLYHIASLPAGKMEKTGAGDAYASGFFAAYLSGKEITEAMRWGIANSYSVMQKVGAQNGLLTKTDIDKMVSEQNIQAEKI